MLAVLKPWNAELDYGAWRVRERPSLGDAAIACPDEVVARALEGLLNAQWWKAWRLGVTTRRDEPEGLTLAVLMVLDALDVADGDEATLEVLATLLTDQAPLVPPGTSSLEAAIGAVGTASESTWRTLLDAAEAIGHP